MKKNILTSNEFLKKICKDEKILKGYRIKFKNIYDQYIEYDNDSLEQYALDTCGTTIYDKMFYNYFFCDEKRFKEWEYDWDYIGRSGFRIFCNYLSVNYTIVKKELSYYDIDEDGPIVYRNYLLIDIWNLLKNIQDNKKFIYGVYVLSNILNDRKQICLKKDIDEKLNELYIEKNNIEKFLLPIKIFQNLPKPIVETVKDINSNYNSNSYNVCFIMMRRLIELLLIYFYESNNKIDEITKGKKNKVFYTLKDMITKF